MNAQVIPLLPAAVATTLPTTTDSRIKYRHYRALRRVTHADGESLEVDPRGGATVAYTRRTMGAYGEQMYLVGIAYCNPRDNYQKHYGRDKAMGRLTQLELHGGHTGEEDDKHLVVDAEDEHELLARLDSFMVDLGDDGYYPR